jgi:tetratricopeptide (TPR) repeat protein
MAVEDYGTLIAKNDQDTTAYLKRGYTYLMSAMYEEAKADFHKALELSVDDAERTKADDGLAKVARMQR